MFATAKYRALLLPTLAVAAIMLILAALLLGYEPARAQSGAATITAVAVSSDAGNDDTYLLDDAIRITLTFSQAVNVSGTPSLKIDMDPANWGEKSASYESGSGSASLVFTHEVVEPNLSTQGIAVLADSLALNGGSIKSASSDTDAELSHIGLAHDAEHQVNWQISAPTVSAVAITSDAGDDDTYALGDVIQVTVIFSEAVDVSGNPQLAIDMDPAEWGEKSAAYESGSGSATLTFAHPVVEPNLSTQGIAVLADTLALNGGSIQSVESDTDADLSHTGLAHDASHKVDWQGEPNHAPVINTESAGYADFTYRGNAPRGYLVSKRFDGIFSDPDGDNLTYSVALASDNSRLVEELTVGPFGQSDEEAAQSGYSLSKVQRVYFTAEAEADWKAMSPRPPDLPVATVTLTATDPSGLTASVEGDFLIRWAAHPELVSAVAREQAIELTFDMELEETPGPMPKQFTVNVVNSVGTAGTIAVSQVSINGSVVTLELGSELSEDQTVTLDYAYNPYYDGKASLRRAGGGVPAYSFTGQAVDTSQLAPPGAVANFAVAATQGTKNVLATWDAVEGATSYKLRWRESDGEFEAANAATVSDPIWVITVSGYGQWEVGVRACNDAGCGPEVSGTVDAVQAARLSLARPLDAEGQVRPRTITATWDAVPEAASYTLRWQRLGTDAPSSAQPDAAALKQTRAVDGVSGDSGPGGNVQTSSELTVPADRTDAELSVPDGGAYQVELKAADDGNELIALAHSHVDQAGGGPDTTPPRLVRGEIDGNRVTLYFSEPLDEGPIGGYWVGGYIDTYVNVGGSVWGWDRTRGSGIEISGNTVTVDLGSQRVGVGLAAYGQYIRRAASTANVLRDLAGNPVSVPYPRGPGWWSTGQMRLDNITGRPHVTGVAISSDAGVDRLYADGDAIKVKITFSEAVNVTGTPRVKIDLDPAGGGEKWADYDASSGSATELTFAYTVEEPDRSTRGAAVLQDTLDLNGGSIRSADTQRNAHLWYAGLGHDPDHQVDWQRLASGVHRVTGVAITSDPGSDRLYVDDETIQVKLTFSDAVNVDTTDGTPRVQIDLDPADGGEKWADYDASGSSSTELTFEYTVSDGDLSTAGVAVLRHTLELNGSAIRSTATTPVNVHLRHAGLDHDPDHQVNSATPMLQSATVDGKKVVMTYDKALNENAAPAGTAFTVKVNGSTVSLAADPVAVRSVAVILTLATAVVESDAVTVSYAKPTAAGATKLRDKAGNEAASFADQPAGPDTTQPTLVRGEIDGDVMTIYFSEALDEDSVSVNTGDHFRVTLDYSEWWAQDGQCPGSDRSFTTTPREVYVNGNTVVVDGLQDDEKGRANVRWTIINFHYIADVAVTQRLRDLSGNPVSTPRHRYDTLRATRVIRLDNVTQLPHPKRATVVGNQLILTFSAPMDGSRVPAASAFTVQVNGSAASLASANPVSVAGRVVTLTLAMAVAAGDTVTVSYAKPESGWLRNMVCEYAPRFTDQAVTNFTGVSPVSSIAITSDPGDDDTYIIGDTIRVTATFSEAVNVDTTTGTPRLKFKMDPGFREKSMWYESGSGTANLVFARKVVEPNLSSQGIAVLANSLELNGGAIRFVSSGKPAHLPHAGLAHDPNHKVDWRHPPPGTLRVTAVAISSDPSYNGTHGLGDSIRVKATFSEAVTVTGAPRLKIKMDPSYGEKWATYESGNGTAELIFFAHTVVEPNLSTQGVAVPEGWLDLNGGAIRSAATQNDAHLWYAGLDHDPNHKVDWRLSPPQPGTPSVTDVAISSDPGDDDTYGLGDSIRVKLTFSEAVAVTGAPSLKIKMDPNYGEKLATYESGNGTAELIFFAHTVVEPNLSTQGVAVLAHTLDLNGGAIRSTATQNDARLWHAGLAHDPNHKVDWQR